MSLSLRSVAACVFALALSVSLTLGCKSPDMVSAASGGADISGPPVYSAEYGSRMARVCGKVTSVPTPAIAAALVQCSGEGVQDASMTLLQDVVVEMGSARPITMHDTDLNDLAAGSSIYPLRGQVSRYSCGLVSTYGQGTNCQKWPAAPGTGVGRCWKTVFGDWKCSMGGWAGNWVMKQPGPRTY